VEALVKHDGASNRALAARLRLSEQTLRNHFTSIYRKLGISNRAQAALRARSMGLT